jgi:hypothetical protein
VRSNSSDLLIGAYDGKDRVYNGLLKRLFQILTILLSKLDLSSAMRIRLPMLFQGLLLGSELGHMT